ncbi:MAG TPA: hypothetical protein VFW98_17335 [Gemmatimonadaceae bacterium]|nr:hypothetical protein [Gemmatimonadaceae bacterium]
MYTTCLYCNTRLGTNTDVPTCPVGRRLAFDPAKGRLWVICERCGCWNLTPLDERWDAIDCCERWFRSTRLRVSTDNVGLAQLRSGLELVRIGPALFPEIASWRYGRRHQATATSARAGLVQRGGRFIARSAGHALASYASSAGLSDEALLRLRTLGREGSVLARTTDERGMPVLIRYRHLREATLVRPERDNPWRLVVRHDDGIAMVGEDASLHTAAKLMATLNGAAARTSDVRYAVTKLDDAGDPDGYFTRIAALAMRTSWGRFPNAGEGGPGLPARLSFGERLAIQLANRSFWGRGGTGSEASTPLYRLPIADRLALEMAANEDAERRAFAGELSALKAAWESAEEIAAIADEMFADDVLDEFKREYYARQMTVG